MDLFLIRHTKPAIEAGICYGQTDVALAQPATDAVGEILARLPDAFTLHSSPLRRCVELAHALERAVVADERLMEIHFGRWEMRPWLDVGAAALEAWQAHGFSSEPHGGESYVDFEARVLDWRRSLREDGDPVVAVTHAGVMRVLLRQRYGWTLEQSLAHPLPYGGIVRLAYPRDDF